MNDVGHDSPNFKGLLGVNLNWLVVRVGAEEAQGGISLLESLDRQFSVECGHDHVPVNGFQ